MTSIFWPSLANNNVTPTPLLMGFPNPTLELRLRTKQEIRLYERALPIGRRSHSRALPILGHQTILRGISIGSSPLFRHICFRLHNGGYESKKTRFLSPADDGKRPEPIGVALSRECVSRGGWGRLGRCGERRGGVRDPWGETV